MTIQNYARVFVQVSLKNMRFFYIDDCGSIAANRVNNDMGNAMYKLIRYLEDEYDVKVRKVQWKIYSSIMKLLLIFINYS